MNHPLRFGLAAAASPAPPIGRLFPWLAPLAGHTDLVFRTLCREQGAAVACTEMVSAKGLVYGQKNKKNPDPTGQPELPGQTLSGASATRQLLRTSPTDLPLVVQLFGEDPDFLGRAVELLRGWGFGWFDLNLGCSVPKVIKTGAGSALARSIPASLAVAKAMLRAAGPVEMTNKEISPAVDNSNNPPQGASGCPLYPASRVGFKLRLGWNREEENYLELASELEQCGAGWLTLHPRYARQGFSGQADYRAVARLAGRLSIPLMLSGDLFAAASALEALRASGASGPMFARGALHNPSIFRDYLELAGSGFSSGPRAASSPDFLRALILRHAELARQYTAEDPTELASETGTAALAPSTGKRKKSGDRPPGSLLKMRGAVPRYIKDLPGSRALRVNLSTCRDWGHFYQLVEDYFSGLS